MTALPDSLALTSIADDAEIIAADHRNNYTAIQNAVNDLIAALSGGAAGDVLQALSGSSVGYLGAFSSYTPTWTSTGTEPAIGNGTITGRYIQVGNLVQAWIVLTMGSTTTFGTGNYIFSLPTSVQSLHPVNFPIGNAIAVRGSVYPLLTVLAGSSSVVLAVPGQPIGGFAGPTAPATFAAGDTIQIQMTYEAA